MSVLLLKDTSAERYLMNVPTEADWRSEEWDDPDREWAYETFHGKTTGEAAQLFEKNALSYGEAVLYMPSRVFGYYLKAYIKYLMSDAAKGDSDGANSFISRIVLKAEHKRDDIIPLWQEIEPVFKKLAEQQDYFDAEWAIYGSFRARIHDIVQLGFHTSFDTATPEIVPEDVTLREVGFGDRSVSFPVAVQIFHNSGIEQIDVASRRLDILRIFGPPDAAGGGDHPKYGRIPDWIRYDRPDCGLYFRFDGDSISNVMFLSRGQSIEIVSADGKHAELLVTRSDALASWNALFEPSPHNKPLNGDIGSKEGGV